MKNVLVLLFTLCCTLLNATNSIDSLVRQYQLTHQPERKVFLSLELANQYLNQDQDSFKYYSFLAFKHFEEAELSQDSLAIAVYKSMGECFVQVNDTAQAFFYYEKALAHCKKSDNQLRKAEIISTIGSAYWQSAAYNKAINHFYIALEIYEKLNYTKGIAIAYNNIALVFADLKRYDKAINYLYKSQRLNSQLGDMLGTAIAFYNIGDVQIEQKNFDGALRFTKKALFLSDSIEDKYGVLLTKANLGLIYRKKGNYALALTEAQEAYNMSKALGYRREQSFTALNLAQIYQYEKVYDASLLMALEALELSKGISSIRERSEVYKCLADSYHATGEDKKAFTHLIKYEKARDSFLMEEKGIIATEIDMRYHAEQKATENNYLKNQIKKDALIIKQQSYITIGIAFCLILLFSIVFILHRKNKQRYQYNEILKHKVNQRTIHLQKANQQLSRANSELESFAYIASHDLKEPLRNITSFANLMQRYLGRGDYDQLEEYLGFIIRSTEQMNALIKDILSFSKINHQSEKPKLVNLASMLKKTKVDLQVLLREKNAKIHFKSNLEDGSIQEIYLPQQVSLVVKNLIENGLKYNTSKTPTIHLLYSRNKKEHVLSFKDNGIGIAPEFHEKIFKMFKRLNRRADYNGSGMGLAICRKVIRNLDGDITVSSMEGAGTSFKCHIPLSATSKGIIINEVIRQKANNSQLQ